MRYLNLHQENYAWGFQYRGMIIDLLTGEVMRYKRSNMNQIPRETKGIHLLAFRIRIARAVGQLSLREKKELQNYLQHLERPKPSSTFANDAGQVSVSVCSKEGKCIEIARMGDSNQIPANKFMEALSLFIYNLERATDKLPPLKTFRL
jgi:hypothetical protein